MYVLSEGATVLKFPYSPSQLRSDNPSTSFPVFMTDEDLGKWNVFPVISQDPPACDPAIEIAEEINPVFVDGQWVQQWEIVRSSPNEIEKRRIDESYKVRQMRNKLLGACDWTQLPDAPVNAQDWAVYRQALRDISGQRDFPWLINWPVAPEN